MQNVQAHVVACQMVMTVELPDGTRVEVNGSAPVGATVSLKVEDIAKNGKLRGYQGFTLEALPYYRHPVLAVPHVESLVVPTAHNATPVLSPEGVPTC